LQAETFLNFSQIGRRVERLLAEFFAEEGLIDVTPAQGGALMILFQARGPLTARELADRMGLSQPTVGRFVKALHSAGWVSRKADPNDARAVLLSPTKKAMNALPRFIRVSNTLFDRAFAGVSQAGIARIATGSEHLRRNLHDD